MTGRTELFRAYEMVTTNPARAAEVPGGVAEGVPANFVVFDCADDWSVIMPGRGAELRRRYEEVAAEADEIVVYCGSGITACVDLLLLARAGREDAKLFPGSWSEWCARGLPVARG